MKSKKLISPKHIGLTFDQDSNPYSALMCAITYQAVEDLHNWKQGMTDLDKKTAFLWVLKLAESYGYQKHAMYNIMKERYNLTKGQIEFYDKILESEVK